MTKVDRNIVEQEVNEMFQEHKTTQGVVEALLIEMGWDSSTIHKAQEARAKKQQIKKEREEKREAKKSKKESHALIQRLAQEQRAEQVEDEKSRSGSRRTLPMVIAVDEKEVVSDEEPETEVEDEDERSAEEVLTEYEEIET